MKCAGQQHEEQKKNSMLCQGERKSEWMKWITQAKHATQFAFIENDKKAALKEAKKEFPAQPRKQNICDSNQSEPKDAQRRSE